MMIKPKKEGALCSGGRKMGYAINVLFINDSQSNAENLATEFIRQGYAIKYDHVNTYHGLINKLRNNSYDLIVSEYCLLGMSVVDVSNLLLAINCEVPLIVISDHDDENDMINCIKAGCRDYLVKSNMSRLKLAVLSICCEAKKHRRSKEEQKQSNIGKELIFTDPDKQIILVNNSAQNSNNFIAEKGQWASMDNCLEQKISESIRREIDLLLKIMNAKDINLYIHSKNVSRYALMIADAVGLNDERKNFLKYASLAHDIGKVTIRDCILYKQDSFNIDEYEEIMKHSTVGAEIMEELMCPGNVPEIIRQHHERIDGTGYPLGLKGDRILLEAKILSVADVYDACTSERVYKKRMSKEKALEIIKNESGKHLDPDLVNVFIRIIKEQI